MLNFWTNKNQMLVNQIDEFTGRPQVIVEGSVSMWD